MQVATRSQEFLSSLTKLSAEDQDTVCLMVMLLARASGPAKRRANEMIASLVTECADRRSVHSRLDEVLAYLMTQAVH